MQLRARFTVQNKTVRADGCEIELTPVAGSSPHRRRASDASATRARPPRRMATAPARRQDGRALLLLGFLILAAFAVVGASIDRAPARPDNVAGLS